MILQVSHWMPGRRLVVVADGTYAVLDFLLKVSRLPCVSVITRLRLDACLYEPAPQREAGKRGRPALKGKRQPKLAERLRDPKTVWEKHTLSWYGGTTREMEIATGTVMTVSIPHPPCGDPLGAQSRSSWPIRAHGLALYRSPCRCRSDRGVVCLALERGSDTFHEVRAHLGVETQRQWSDLAIARTTPALLGLFSLVTIFAQQLLGEQPFPIRQAACYSKALPTFSDTLAFVRQHLWPSAFFSVSSREGDTVQIPRALFDRFVDTLAFAAS